MSDPDIRSAATASRIDLDKILKAQAGDLPGPFPPSSSWSQHETAKALGLAIPQSCCCERMSPTKVMP